MKYSQKNFLSPSRAKYLAEKLADAVNGSGRRAVKFISQSPDFLSIMPKFLSRLCSSDAVHRQQQSNANNRCA
jgi:hypothetical protein